MYSEYELSCKLKEYILNASGKTESEVDFDKKVSLIDDLGLDSIEIVDLIVFIESEFGISCDSDDLVDKLDDFNELIYFLTSNLSIKA